ncbi:MAG: hypothetical protein CMJ77_17590 [Planctomycetaceae bacterium]|nr:hypothetical protein [Planctomycetaceae bacterium]
MAKFILQMSELTLLFYAGEFKSEEEPSCFIPPEPLLTLKWAVSDSTQWGGHLIFFNLLLHRRGVHSYLERLISPIHLPTATQTGLIERVGFRGGLLQDC